MGLKQQVDLIYNNVVETNAVRYVAHPVGAGVAAVSDSSAAAWAWSAYVEIVAAAVIPNPCWLAGISFRNGVVEDIDADLAIASGAAAAEVDLAIIPIRSILETSVGMGIAPPIWLPIPILIVGTPRLAVRIRKDTAASLAGGTLKAIIATGIR